MSDGSHRQRAAADPVRRSGACRSRGRFGKPRAVERVRPSEGRGRPGPPSDRGSGCSPCRPGRRRPGTARRGDARSPRAVQGGRPAGNVGLEDLHHPIETVAERGMDGVIILDLDGLDPCVVVEVGAPADEGVMVRSGLASSRACSRGARRMISSPCPIRALKATRILKGWF